MNNLYTRLTLGVLFFFMFNSVVFADETNCNDTRVDILSVESSECAASGKIVARLSGPDTAHISMDRVQFRVVSQTPGVVVDPQFNFNGGVFQNLAPASYIVQSRAFCHQLDDSIQVTKNSAVVTITGNYQSPNIFVGTENIRKTLNCKVSGMIPIGFYGGKAPYTATMKSYPAEYTGDTIFTRTGEGTFEVNNLPAGTYVFDLEDACGYTLPNQTAVVAKTTSDFPTITSLSTPTLYSYDCKSLYFYYYFTISESHELFYYMQNYSTYYDPVLYEDDNTAVLSSATSISSPTLTGTAPNRYYYRQRVAIPLKDLTFGDLYPAIAGWEAGGHSAYATYRIKGTDCVSTQAVKIPVANQYATSYRYGNINCDGINVFATHGSSSYVYGLLCFPIKGEIYDAITDTLITANNNITSYSETLIGRVPFGSKYYFKFTSLAGGASWTYSTPSTAPTTFTAPDSTARNSYLASYRNYSTCGEVYGKRGHIYIRNNSNYYYGFVPGTVIKLVEAPEGQVFPHDSLVVRDSVTTYIYPYSATNPFHSYYSSSSSTSAAYMSDMMAGIHKFEIIDPCNGRRDTITVNYPDKKVNIYFTYSKYSYCPENGKGGYIGFYDYNGYNNYYPIGSVIKVKSAPEGQVIPHDSIIITSKTITYIYPYSPSPTSAAYADIKPGVHVFQVITPCGDTVEQSYTWTENVPSYSYSYNDYSYGPSSGHYYTYNHCKDNLGKFYAYIYSSSTYIPGGTRIKLKSGPTGYDPATVIHTDVTIPGGTTRYFNPFSADYTDYSTYMDLGNIKPGTYTFDVYDAACEKDVTASLVVPDIMTIATPLSVTADYSCSGAKVTPYGLVRYSTNSNKTTYFKIRSAWNSDGTTMSTADYDVNQITAGQSFNLYKNGRYLIQMYTHGQTSTSYCFSDTLSFFYEQPAPRLDLTKTSAYVCAGETVGYLRLRATGGHGNGPYEYRIYGTDSLNYTGDFRYGAPGEELEIIVTDMSPEAIAKDCHPYFKQKVIMVDLKDSGIAYTIADRGIFCEGTTIDLNMISLGETRYDWTGPNGFVADSVQYPRIPDAALNMSGWYKVTVEAEHCGVPYVDSVYVDVRENPTDVTIDTDTLELCRRSTAYYIDLLNPQASSGCTLKWYDYNGDEMTVTSTTAINTNNIGTRTYWVSQVNDDSKCEGPKTPFVITIRVPPTNPNVLYPDAICMGDSVYFKITDTRTDYKYRLHLTNADAFVKESYGNGDTLKMSYNPIYAQTNYWFSLEDDLGCISGRSQATVEMAPYGVLADINLYQDTVCALQQGTAVVTSLTLSNPIYRWYSSTAVDATLLQDGGTSFTATAINYTSNSISSSVVAYLSIEADGLCETPPANRIPVRIYVKGTMSSSYIYMNPSTSNTICHGDSILIRPYSAYTTEHYYDSVFYWYTGQYESIPFHVGDSLWMTPATNSTTTYYVGFSSRYRCETLQGNRRSVSVSDRNIELKYPSNITEICNGTNVQMQVHLNGSYSTTNNSRGTWTSSDESVARISTSGYITSVGPGKVAFTYKYTYNLPNCEVVSDTLTIKPLATFTFAKDSICVGDTIRLTASEAGTWYATNSRVQVLNNLADVVGVSPGTVAFNFTGSTTGCSNTTQTLTVVGYPTVSPITGANFVCVGNILNLSNATSGGYWDSENHSIATINGSSVNTSPTIVLAVSEGETNITYTVNSAGALCNTTVKHPLTVLPLTPPTITIGISE